MGSTYHVHVLIRGRVQGVGFRYWLAGEAENRMLDGWVRNRRDSSVEAVFSGEESAVKDMVAVCGVGPRLANVEGIELLDARADPGHGFAIKPTV